MICKCVKYLSAPATLCTAAAVTSTAAFSGLFIPAQNADGQYGYAENGHSYNNICKIHKILH